MTHHTPTSEQLRKTRRDRDRREGAKVERQRILESLRGLPLASAGRATIARAIVAILPVYG